MDVIGVEMEEVEVVCPLKYSFGLEHMVGQWVLAGRVGSKRLLATDFEVGTGVRVTAGKKCYFVSHSYQFFGQIVHHSFSAAVCFGWNRFVQGCDLCDSHFISFSLAHQFETFGPLYFGMHRMIKA